MYRIKVAWVVLIMIIFAIIDATALNYVKIYGVKPDLFLIGILFFSLYGGLKVGLISGASAGLIKEIFIAGSFGINFLLLTAAGLFFGYNFSKFYREKTFAQAILSFLVSIGYVFFYYFCLKFVMGAKGLPFPDIGVKNLTFRLGIPFSLYTALITPFFFFLLHKMFRVKY